LFAYPRHSNQWQASIASNDKQALEAYARSSSAAQNYLEGKEIKKVIAVPGKLVNFVVV